MYILKGFFAHSSLISNQLNEVAKFGELSANSASYAKDKLFYTNTELAPQTTLVVFHTVKDDVRVEVPVNLSNNALGIGNFILERAFEGIIPADAYVLRQQLNAEFSGSAIDFEVGLILDDFGFKMPEWIRYTDTTNAEPNEITIWLADASFSAQYDEFSIEVIPPLLPVDNFFKDPLTVKNLLLDYDLVTKTDEAQAKRGQYPFTQIKTFRYDYHNPAILTDLTPTYWIILIYGQAGNNPDLIREAIVKEVLSNSEHTQEEWAVILPDLFRTTEHIFTPMWVNYSVPNHEFHAGFYSPTIDPRKALTWIKRTARGVGYSDGYVEQRYEFTQNIYRSIAMGVIGNPDNRDGITQFKDRFSDYMVVSNNTADYNRMSVTTQEFSNLLSNLLVAAESMTPFTAVPMGLSRVTRDGVVYATGFFKNVNYLVVSKYSAEQYFN